MYIPGKYYSIPFWYEGLFVWCWGNQLQGNKIWGLAGEGVSLVPLLTSDTGKKTLSVLVQPIYCNNGLTCDIYSPYPP